MDAGLKLNLGCGGRKLEGYVGVDFDERADIVGDIRDLSWCISDSVDEIVASHVIEHFYKWEVQPLLAEWKRVLKPGGDIYLECPNILQCAAMLLKGGFSDQFTLWGFYGTPKGENPLMHHKWGYSPQTLAEELYKAGFVEIYACDVVKVHGRDMRLAATKPIPDVEYNVIREDSKNE